MPDRVQPIAACPARETFKAAHGVTVDIVLGDREEFSLVRCGLVEMAVQYVQTAIQVGVGDLSSRRREIAATVSGPTARSAG